MRSSLKTILNCSDRLDCVSTMTKTRYDNDVTMLVCSITLLSCLVFVTGFIWSDRARQLNFIFNVDHTYTISYVIVVFGFPHRPHPIQLVMTTQFHFQRIPHLYDQSHCCLVWFSSQIVASQIGLDSSFSMSE